MKINISILILLFTLSLPSYTQDQKHLTRVLTYSDFEKKLKPSMAYDTIVAKLGEPSEITGSGLRILVYNLIDSSRVFIGYTTNRILYVRHVDKKHNLLHDLRYNSSQDQFIIKK